MSSDNYILVREHNGQWWVSDEGASADKPSKPGRKGHKAFDNCYDALDYASLRAALHDVAVEGPTPPSRWELLETRVQELEAALRERDVLLHRMLAIHSMAFDESVTFETYTGAAHEEAEEDWLVDVRAVLAASVPTEEGTDG